VQSVTVGPGGSVTIVIIPSVAGTATLTITVPTASIAAAGKRCKPGKVRIKKRCAPARTVLGVKRARGRPGVKLKLTVVLHGKAAALLRHRKALHAIATLTYSPSGGGTRTVKSWRVTLKRHK
jgi:hypothetical protein